MTGINNLFMQDISQDLTSSTPDGLAPLSHTGVLVFSLVLSILPLGWAAGSFIMMFRSTGEEEGQQQTQVTFKQLCSKILVGVLQFLKYNYMVSLVAGLVFFLVILGGIDGFSSPSLSLIYLYGLLQCIAIGLTVAVVSQIGINRLGKASTFSLQAVDWIMKLTSNFVSFFICGLACLVLALILVVGQPERPSISEEDVKNIGQKCIVFAFGVSTVAIGTKINSVIYGKSSEAGLALMAELQPTLKRDHANPAVICKAVGQNVRKIFSNATDYNMYLCMSLGLGVSAGGMNIIGADQQGQIIFSLSSCNLFLPLIAMLFLMFFALLANVVFTFLFRPSSGQQVALTIKRQIYVVVIFMSGFLALAAYLCLPVEFFIKEEPGVLKSPSLAYLCLLISLFALLAFLMVSQMQVNHPRGMYQIILAGGQSEASGIVSCLELGWIGSMIPGLLWAALCYLSQYWLGSFGVALIALGTALLIPSYLGINTYYSLGDNSSFCLWVGEVGQDSLRNVMQINESRNLFEIQVNSHFTSLALTTNYALALNYLRYYGLTHIPLVEAGIIIGLIIGAFIIYSFGSVVLLCIQEVTPLLYLDVKAQQEEGLAELDTRRSNSLLCFHSILQFKYMIPYLFLPFVLIGLAFGPKVTIGVISGMLVTGLQLAFSNGLSGSLWIAARSEVFLGKAVLNEEQRINAQSDEGRAVDLGNEIGMRLKDAVGSCIHGYISFTALTNAVMGVIYCSIHG